MSWKTPPWPSCLVSECTEKHLVILQRLEWRTGEDVFVWVWNQGAGDFIEWIWECSFFFKFLEYFEEDRCKFFVCLVELPEEVVQSWNFVHMEFLLLLLQILFHFVWLACSNYLIFLYSVLAGSIFLEPCLFVLGGPICWNTTVNSILLWFFFSWGCYFSSFISYFV